MSLTPGSRLGSFEITGALGAGGMGEVYRARDTKLNRDVAIKVLPDSFALEPDRLARFKREAQVLASLGHPNIAAIFGLDEAHDRQFLVLELVEGETLDKRIARGPIPVDEAIAIARQIADALEAAHERGVVHRDLKPANVAISEGDQIKVLDFGLAKALVGDGSAEHAALITNSPTLTSPIGITGVGVLLGTAPYMSPEQARGKTVDKRADIWAFGCVLYEMLTGRRAFGGEDVSVTLAEIIRGEVDWTAVPAQAPAGVRRILERCLQKDVKLRFRDIGDVRLALDGAFDSPDRQNAQPLVAPARWRRMLPWAAAVMLSAVTGGIVWLMTGATPPTPPVTRFAVTPGPQFNDLTISPDGKSIAFISAGQLFVRPIDRLDAMPFAGLGPIREPFFSPDGAWIGYFSAAGGLRKVPVAGGSSTPITDPEGPSRGATWGPDGTIVFATVAPSGLLRVSAAGGTPSVLTTPDPAQNEMDHLWPQLLPDGKTILFTILRPGSFAIGDIATVDLATGSRKILVRGAGFGGYVPTGHLLFARSGALHAVAFDAERVEVTGEEVTIVERVVTTGSGRVRAAVSNTGTLVYESGGSTEGLPRTLTWVDRSGREQPVGAETKSYSVPRVSTDGTRIVASTEDGDVLVYDVKSKVTFPLTFGSDRDIRPMWSTVGNRVLFRSDDASGPAIYHQAADGSGRRERFISAPGDGSPNAMTPDGKTLVYSKVDQSTGRDLWVLNLETRENTPLIVKTGHQGNAAISPDGRWIAYHDETEGGYIYVHPFPAVDATSWRISDAGSKWPAWSRDGKELFYVSTSGPSMMAVPVDLSGTSFTWGAAQRLFPSNYANFQGVSGARNYDVTPDGRFLMIKEESSDSAPEPIIVVQNWDQELKRLVPRK